ncbi:LysR substrate-binding domain-containing protein [Rhizobiaceae bacterium BDR2-2]|uniref:LysR substrate-binding domain-containing protein n=1 Tax=Ectorhizobium quercum TaxID=2965071 RepID=A0AAE3SSW2_9HYPH|nr:LysR substrate-binding domain-containing protein [Ectorhizobium quercum]MCX8995510.1 LysR substrate-binding domain-containing protein [Ectorhizobium quercum]
MALFARKGQTICPPSAVRRTGPDLPVPLPLVVSEQGCRWRARAIEALEEQKRSFEIVCTSKATGGQLAAVQAGLGVSPLPASVIAGHAEIRVPPEGLPLLDPCELGLVRAEGARTSRPVSSVVKEILAVFGIPR